MGHDRHNSEDSFLGNYKPSELQIASEFLTTWAPFLSENLCPQCAQYLSDRICSIAPDSSRYGSSDVADSNDTRSHKIIENHYESCATNSIRVENNNEDTNQNQSVEVYGKFESQHGLGICYSHSLEVECIEEENKANESVTLGTPQKKSTLSREQREYIRFMNVRRKKDFACFERVKGKRVNILQGLELHEGVFSVAEQTRIINYVTSLQDMGKNGELQDRTFSAPHKWMRGKGRQTLQFGCCYNYAVDREGNPPGILSKVTVDPLPDLFKVMIQRMVKWHVLPPTCVPDSCIVNIYDEGDCIPPHIDNHDFVRPFCTVSFLSECNILFGSNLKIVGPGEFEGSFSISLPLGSVLVLNGNGADVAKHCVPAVPSKRISITFRKMDESKRPIGYVAEPDLQGLEPLAYEVVEEKRSDEPKATGHAKRDRQEQRRHRGKDKNYSYWESRETRSLQGPLSFRK